MRTCLLDNKNIIIADNWTINKTIDSSDTFSFTIVDFDAFTVSDLTQNLVVEFTSGATTLFKGLVKEYDIFEISPNNLNCSIKCLDFSSIADRRKVALAIENTTIDDIITTHLITMLTEEGVTIGYVSAPVSVTKAVFNYISVRDCLNYLKDLGNYTWYINASKQLYFYSRAENVNPLTLNNSISHFEFTKTSNMDTYRNVQYVRSGKVRTNTITKELATPQPYADKDDKNFFVRYPVADKPQIYVNDIEIDQDDIGVNGLHTGMKWYFNYNSNVISQDASETALTTGKLEITYVGLRDAITVAENTEEIYNRKLVESTSSGRYEELSKASFLDTTLQSLEYANAILAKYSDISDGISFSMINSSYSTGELISVDKQLFGINDYFLCTNVTITGFDAESELYDIKCLDGASVGGWEEYFRKLLEVGKDFIITDGEVLIILNQITESVVNYGFYVFYTCPNVLYVSDSTIVSDTLILNNSAIYDFIRDF